MQIVFSSRSLATPASIVALLQQLGVERSVLVLVWFWFVFGERAQYDHCTDNLSVSKTLISVYSRT